MLQIVLFTQIGSPSPLYTMRRRPSTAQRAMRHDWLHVPAQLPGWSLTVRTPAQAALYGTTRYVMFDWKPEMGTTLHLINLMTGAVRKVSAPAYFTFHYVNAFEAEDGSALCFDFARCAPGPCWALLPAPRPCFLLLGLAACSWALLSPSGGCCLLQGLAACSWALHIPARAKPELSALRLLRCMRNALKIQRLHLSIFPSTLLLNCKQPAPLHGKCK